MSKGEETRQRIVDRAMELINQRGIAGTAISDIMESTGLQKGGIYRHFSDKEEIVDAAFAEYVGRVRARLKDCVHERDRAPERLKAIVRLLAGIATDPIVPGGCMLINLAAETDHSGVGPREQVGAAFRNWERLLRDELRRGIAAGEIRKGADVDEFIALCISSIEGSILLQAHRARLRPTARVIDFLERWIDRLSVS